MKDVMNIAKAKGRPMLQWVGKKPLERVEYYPAQEKEVYGNKTAKEFNKLFWGDNLQVLAHLLKEYRGEVDLIYIDPPFDSKADYVKRVKIRTVDVEGQSQSLLEEKQYTDMWENDEYLQFMYERLLLMKELLSDKGSIYLHCDYHKVAYLRLIMDEVFGEDNFRNEVIWKYFGPTSSDRNFPRKHDNILFYSKTPHYKFHSKGTLVDYDDKAIKRYDKVDENGKKYKVYIEADSNERKAYMKEGKPTDVFEIPFVQGISNDKTDYPTQKPEALIEKFIVASTDEDDLVLDSFCGSGTTMAVAQKLGRKWIGCDINLGAIQTSTKRLSQIIEEQSKLKDNNPKGLDGFKVLNVNEYDIFKNDIEAKDLVMEMYGIEPIKRSYFDGTLDNNFVKVMSMNRVLNKLDVKTIIKSIQDSIDSFATKPISKTEEAIYEQGVIIICSGAELDTADYLKKENTSGVAVEIRDILNDKKNLIFKKKPEALIEVLAHNKKLKVMIKEFYSPILMRKLDIENQSLIDKHSQVKVEDFKQIIDSVAIDVDYNMTLFNAEIMDLPTKKDVIKGSYEYEYKTSGKNTVAVKIVDVLGEEYFETFTVSA